MQVYLDNIVLGIIAFPFLALLITIPYMIYQYRKFGSIPGWRTFLVYLFVFYLLVVYFMAILPLPESRTAVVEYASHPQLIPFYTFWHMFGLTGFSLEDPSTWIDAFANYVFIETVFNILLFVPLGMFLRYYLKRKWWQTFLIGFGMSLFIEITQLTGLYGIYAHPYRLFDVDDLIFNTFGVMVGFWIMGPAAKLLPNMTLVDQEAREEGVRASLLRRMLSVFLDGTFSVVAAALVAALASLFGVSLFETPFAYTDALVLVQIATLVVFFILIPSLSHGQTLGQKMLKLVIVKPDGRAARWYQITARYGLLFVVFFLPLWLLDLLQNLLRREASIGSLTLSQVDQLIPLLTAFFGVLFLVWLISLPFRNRHAKKQGKLFVMINELVSGTRIMTIEGAAALHDRMVVLDVAEVASLEYMIAKDGLSLAELMERAGQSVVAAIRQRNPRPTKVLIACGSGNNGGDGWVVARELAKLGYEVTVISTLLPTEVQAEPAKAAAMEAFSLAHEEEMALRIVVKPDDVILEKTLASTEVIVDAMLGTGFSGQSVREPYGEWIEALNKYSARNKDSFIVSIDVPSGYSAQTGEHAKPCIVADLTVTMLAFKPGLLGKDAAHYCGTIKLSRLTDITPYLERFEKKS